MNEYPKILVISHNCFSKHGSNGRTLANFFIDWPQKSLAQFYINNEIPDSEVCNNYYRVTDVEVLKSFLKRIKVGKHIAYDKLVNSTEENKNLNTLYKRSRKRTPLNYLIRNFLWDRDKWRSKEFEEWIDKFDPDLILLQLGDYSFMLRIALKLAKYKKIPLIVYNSEDYYFKDQKSFSPLYHFYRLDYKRQVERVINYASHSIYNSRMLQNTYNKKFDHESTVIMTSTDIEPSFHKVDNNPMIISYLGNLGVGRHEPLIEIANAVHCFDKNLYLDIYGKIPNEEAEKSLMECNGIRIKGFIPYEEVIKVVQQSDVLIHAENFSEFYRWDLKHAFSTKIADSLASGTCFFMYAPEDMAATKYIKENDIAYVANSKSEMEQILNELISKKQIRKHYITKAQKIVKLNHDINKNSEQFKSLMINKTKG